jgi:hypothetical protein
LTPLEFVLIIELFLVLPVVTPRDLLWVGLAA